MLTQLDGRVGTPVQRVRQALGVSYSRGDSIADVTCRMIGVTLHSHPTRGCIPRTIEQKKRGFRNQVQNLDLESVTLSVGFSPYPRGRSRKTRSCRGVTYQESCITKYTTYTKSIAYRRAYGLFFCKPPFRSTAVADKFSNRFRGGFVFKAHRLVYHSTLGLSVIKKKKRLLTNSVAGGHRCNAGFSTPAHVSDKHFKCCEKCRVVRPPPPGFGGPGLVSVPKLIDSYRGQSFSATKAKHHCRRCERISLVLCRGFSGRGGALTLFLTG